MYPLPTTTTCCGPARQRVEHGLPVVERLHPVDALAVDAGQVGTHGLGTGRDDQPVVADRVAVARPTRCARRGRSRSPRRRAAGRCRSCGAPRASARPGRRQSRRRRRSSRGCRRRSTTSSAPRSSTTTSSSSPQPAPQPRSGRHAGRVPPMTTTREPMPRAYGDWRKPLREWRRCARLAVSKPLICASRGPFCATPASGRPQRILRRRAGGSRCASRWRRRRRR